ncbi:Uncharacterized protein HZ326_16335 [Fusarium oxysporum f. sp. albedinis]|nr:Uncharacterized protein HZ326_16335 [Fusarium oxysporum f. sp. albedinis]
MNISGTARIISNGDAPSLVKLWCRPVPNSKTGAGDLSGLTLNDNRCKCDEEIHILTQLNYRVINLTLQTFHLKDLAISSLVKTLSSRTLLTSEDSTKCTSEIPDAPVDIKNILSHKCLCYGTLVCREYYCCTSSSKCRSIMELMETWIRPLRPSHHQRISHVLHHPTQQRKCGQRACEFIRCLCIKPYSSWSPTSPISAGSYPRNGETDQAMQTYHNMVLVKRWIIECHDPSHSVRCTY